VTDESSSSTSPPPGRSPSGPKPDRSGGFGQLLLGLVAGVVLSGLYIKFNWALPAWIQLPGLVQSLGPRTVADAVLEDPAASLEAKQRAVEELFRHDPNLFRELDDALDQAFTRAVLDRKARRRLQLFHSKQKTRRRSLQTHEALREAAMRHHGTHDFEELLVRMGRADLQEDPFFHAYLRDRFPEAPDDQLYEETLRLRPSDLFPAPPLP